MEVVVGDSRSYWADRCAEEASQARMAAEAKLIEPQSVARTIEEIHAHSAFLVKVDEVAGTEHKLTRETLTHAAHIIQLLAADRDRLVNASAGGDEHFDAAMESHEHWERRAAAAEAEVRKLKMALQLALKYWQDRQQRYKNKHPLWVVRARKVLGKDES